MTGQGSAAAAHPECPYKYKDADFNDGHCPAGFKGTGLGHCPWGFEKQFTKGSHCPYGYDVSLYLLFIFNLTIN